MDFSAVLDLLIILPVVAGAGVFFYFYYKNEKVRSATKKVFRFAPFLLSILVAKIPDKKGVFDAHDMAVLVRRLFVHINTTVNDPTNVSFDDVQDDLFDFVRTELDRYRDAGVKGVPEVDEEVIRVQVKVVFEAIQRALNEDPTGDDSAH